MNRKLMTTALVAGLAVSGLLAAAPGAGATTDDALARFYRQSITWHGCRQGPQDGDGQALDAAGARCAEVTVPLDYGWPASWIPRSAGADRQGFRETVTLDRDLTRRCARVHGDLLPFASTANAARDLDVVRAALGEPRLSFLGYSYGSYLDALYGRAVPAPRRPDGAGQRDRPGAAGRGEGDGERAAARGRPAGVGRLGRPARRPVPRLRATHAGARRRPGAAQAGAVPARHRGAPGRGAAVRSAHPQHLAVRVLARRPGRAAGAGAQRGTGARRVGRGGHRRGPHAGPGDAPRAHRLPHDHAGRRPYPRRVPVPWGGLRGRRRQRLPGHRYPARPRPHLRRVAPPPRRPAARRTAGRYPGRSALAEGAEVARQQVGVDDVGPGALDRAVDAPLRPDVVALVGNVDPGPAGVRHDRRPGAGAVAQDQPAAALRPDPEGQLHADPVLAQPGQVGTADVGAAGAERPQPQAFGAAAAAQRHGDPRPAAGGRRLELEHVGEPASAVQGGRNEQLVGDAPDLVVAHLQRLATADHALDLGALAVAAAGAVPVVLPDVEPPAVAFDHDVPAVAVPPDAVGLDAFEGPEAVLDRVGLPQRLRRGSGTSVRPRLRDGDGGAHGGESEGSEYGSAPTPTRDRECGHVSSPLTKSATAGRHRHGKL